MASLITPRMRFLHVPKTGGSWATQAMFAAGVAADRPDDMVFHAGLAESSGYAGRFTFAFVRHPLDFWRSYWGYRMRAGWDQLSAIDDVAAADTFSEFIEGILAHAPGAAGTLFESYVGPPTDEIDFIGRHERLVDDLCLALRQSGEAFDEQRLRAHPPVNVNDYEKHPARYSRSAAERLVQAERKMINRFTPGIRCRHDCLRGRR